MIGTEELPPLARAVVLSDLAAVQVFLYCGANPNLKSLKGDTPLFLAVKTESAAVVDLLLRAGAEVNAHNSAGNTVLHLLAGMDAVGIGEVLIKHGALQRIRNERWQYPIHLAVRGNNIEMTRLFQENDPGVWDLNDLNGKKPWEYGMEPEIKKIHDRRVLWRERRSILLARKLVPFVARLSEGLYRQLVLYF